MSIDTLKNIDLFNFKKKILLKLKTNFKNKDVQPLSYTYHKVDLALFTDSEDFREDIQLKIPTEWRKELQKSDFEIHFSSPEDYGISVEKWSDEESQDCIDDCHLGLGIQRDFAAIKLNEKKYIVIIDLKICDGFYNFLRWFISRQLIDRNILVLHSSCVLDAQGQAHFFLGHSGAGKTTTTSFSGKRKVLGDDMNLLHFRDGEVFASAGAIGGVYLSDVGYDREFKVSSFNWLIQSLEVKRNHLSKSDSYLKLIASVSNIFWETLEQDKIDRIVELIGDVVASSDCYELYLKKDSSFWNLIENS